LPKINENKNTILVSCISTSSGSAQGISIKLLTLASKLSLQPDGVEPT
jgi:hypothetical protein